MHLNFYSNVVAPSIKVCLQHFWIEFDHNMFEAMKQKNIDKLKNQILFHQLLSHFLQFLYHKKINRCAVTKNI